MAKRNDALLTAHNDAAVPTPPFGKTTEPPEPLYDEIRASSYLQELGAPIAPATLRKKRCVGGGPEFFKSFGGRVFYRRHALNEWAESQRSAALRSTSDLPNKRD